MTRPARGPAWVCSNPLCGTHASSGGSCSQCGQPMTQQG